MKKHILASLILAFSGLSHTVYAQQILRLGVDPTFAPFESKATDGSLQGFDIDLGNAICAQAKVTCQWVEIGFDATIPALNARKFDAILSAMAMTDKRREQVAFSDMLYNTPNALVALNSSTLSKDMASLRGKNIGVAQGTIHETYAKDKWASEGVNIISYANQMEIYPDLVSGRLDGSLTNIVSAEQGFLNQQQGKNFAVKAIIVDNKVFGEGTGIALRKDDNQNLQLINQALAEMHKNGTYDRLAKKYFNYSVYP
ncbi:ABC transporter substrate-binding protein [Buttiauxella sp.]|uniref:ABC transporter substrate-binding protein n=1 Tax=Buttiauxella sp. TaxID=1972222 RepID=UPI003C735A6C